MKEIDLQIIKQIYNILHKLGASEEILSVVGSYKDTLSDEDVLALLIEYNKEEILFKHKDSERKDINPNNN